MSKKIKEPTIPSKMGAPTKYKPEHCEMLVEHMGKGFSFESFAGVDGVDVDRDTLYSWRDAQPNFYDALRRGRSKQLLKDETTLNLGLDNTLKVNHTLMSLKMFNCHNWKTKTEVTELKPASMTDEELLKEAKALIAKAES